MTTVRWHINTGGFMVDITNAEGNNSQDAGDFSVDKMNINLDNSEVSSTAGASSTTRQRVPNSPNQVAPGMPGQVRIDISPIVVKASACCTDEGMIDAYWHVGTGNISGKGVGKGLGKSATPYTRPPP